MVYASIVPLLEIYLKCKKFLPVGEYLTVYLLVDHHFLSIKPHSKERVRSTVYYVLQIKKGVFEIIRGFNWRMYRYEKGKTEILMASPHHPFNSMHYKEVTRNKNFKNLKYETVHGPRFDDVNKMYLSPSFVKKEYADLYNKCEKTHKELIDKGMFSFRFIAKITAEGLIEHSIERTFKPSNKKTVWKKKLKGIMTLCNLK